MNVLLYQPHRYCLTETFIRAHAEYLPFRVSVIHGFPAQREGVRLLADTAPQRALRKVDRLLRRKDSSWEMTRSVREAIRRYRPEVVLAEYGPSGVLVREACELAGVPLVVCFHGFDASVHEVLKANEKSYRELFQSAHAVVAGSRAMADRLRRLGAGDVVRLIPYGVDVERYLPGEPEKNPATFLAVGRFVEKKAPYLTLAAFAQVLRQRPQATLRLIGDGPLFGVCQDLVRAWGLEDAVKFLGPLPQEKVAAELGRARAFLQHSIEATDGDCEGLPIAILEAGAMGLPTISTRHAGIPDAVLENETGLLVDEKDVNGMAQAMISLVDDPARAGRLGRKARVRVATYFSMRGQIAELAALLRQAAAAKASPVRATFPRGPRPSTRLTADSFSPF